MINLKYAEIDGLLYPNIQLDDAEIDQSAFDMAECIQGRYLKESPDSSEGVERIQAFAQAQMLADEAVILANRLSGYSPSFAQNDGAWQIAYFVCYLPRRRTDINLTRKTRL